MVLIMLVGARWMLRIVTVPKAALFPIVLVLCVIGAYALNNTMANVYVLLLFGVLGYAMVKAGFPLAPFILGVILGDQIEINLVRSLMTDDNPWLFFTRPISGCCCSSRWPRSSSRSGSTGAGKKKAPSRRTTPISEAAGS